MASIRLATWNIQHGKPDPAKVAACLELLAESDVDVVALQEVDRRTTRVDGRDLAVEAADAFGGDMVWAPAIAYKGGEYGNALLVRGEVRDSVCVVLPMRRRGEPRCTVLTEVEVSGRSWTIAATHLTTDRSAVRRQLLAVLDALATRPAPRILMGDLNLEPDLLLPWLTAEGYRPALSGPTHSVRRPRRQIDHIVVRGRDCAIKTLETREFPVADHLALLAEITCP